jgi:hypothetical protein
MGFGGHPLTAFFLRNAPRSIAVLLYLLLLFFHLLLQVRGRILGIIDDLVDVFLDGLVARFVTRKQRILVIDGQSADDDQGKHE